MKRREHTGRKRRPAENILSMNFQHEHGGSSVTIGYYKKAQLLDRSILVYTPSVPPAASGASMECFSVWFKEGSCGE